MQRSFLTRCLLIFTLLAFSGNLAFGSVYSRNTKFTLNLEEVTVKKVFETIEEQSEFIFFYQSDLMDFGKTVNIKTKEKRVEDILDQVLAGGNVSYKIIDRQIVLKEKGQSAEKQMETTKATEDAVLELKVPSKPQQHEVSGTVTDAQSGDPLPGVNIVVQGTTTGTTTNMDGEYSIEAPADATLVFSFVGYQEVTVDIESRQQIDVTMEQAVTQLEEVVAIGYGSLKKSDVSTSISSVDTDNIEDMETANIDRTLEGKVAGMSIKQNTGSPGGGAEIRIRGSGSIGAGDDPLVVVDGVPINNTYGKKMSALGNIDPSNIQSIDVLKGVSATAIYGSRGSNGVILIETKEGTSGETELSFTAKTGLSNMLESEKLDLLNAEEFARWRKQSRLEEVAFRDDIDDVSEIGGIPEDYQNPEQYAGKGTDWQEVLTRWAPQQKYNLSVSHGTEDFQGFFSIGYVNQKGIVKYTNFERLNLRANMDYTPNEVINVSLNIHPTLRKRRNYVASGRGGTFGIGSLASPLDGPYEDDGIYEDDREAHPERFDGEWDLNIHSGPGYEPFPFTNPLYQLKEQTDRDKYMNWSVQPALELTPLEGLTFKSQLSMQWGDNERERFTPSGITAFWAFPPGNPNGTYNTSSDQNWQFENTLRYENTFGSHNISALAGYTREHYNTFSSFIRGQEYPSDLVRTINAANNVSGNTLESNWSLASYMFRLHYDYNSKYLFTGTIRRDGSSRFGADKRWGYFPSASVGWNVSKEDFFPDSDWLTNLKLRASYGVSGNNSIGNYTWIPNLQNNNYTFGGSVASGKSQTGIENRNLTWERSSEYDAGIDLTLLDGRLNFIFDYYNKITENMLWDVDIPISSGFDATTKNLGKIRNRGVEFSVNSVNISNEDFRWSTDFNISFNRNKILDLGADRDKIEYNYHWVWHYTLQEEGRPMSLFYGWETTGIWDTWEQIENNPTYEGSGGQEPGTPIFVDQNDDGVITREDFTAIGNPHPDFRGGFSSRLQYKNWDFNVSTSFAHNFDIWAWLQADVLNFDGVFNVLDDVKNRWRSPENPGDGTIPKTFGATNFDRWADEDWVHNVSYLKIQNVTLGYTFDNWNLINQFSPRLFFSVQNAAILSNYRFGNPDVNYYGNNSLVRNVDKYAYPLSRTYVLGLNINF